MNSQYMKGVPSGLENIHIVFIVKKLEVKRHILTVQRRVAKVIVPTVLRIETKGTEMDLGIHM